MVRRIIYTLMAAAAVWFVAAHTGEIVTLWKVMRGGDWRWLVVAVALQVGYYAFYIWVYQACFEAVGIKRRYRELVPVVLGTFFVNVVTPSAGTAGTVLVVGDSVKRGNSMAASTAAWLLTQAVDFASFAVIMVAGFIYLAVSGHLKSFEVVAAVALTALILLFAGLFVLALVREQALVKILGWAERAITWTFRLFRRPAPLQEGWAAKTGAEFTQSARLLTERPRTVVKAGVVGVSGYLLDVLGLIAVGYAFRWNMPGSLLAAYAVGVLVWMTSIVPQGIGIVEGAIALVLVSFGAVAAQATAISLVFRGLSFWIPMALGFVLLRRVSTFQPERRSVQAEEFSVRLAAVLVAAVGVVNILSAVTPSLRVRVLALEQFLPFEVPAGHLAAALAGLGLIVLSRALWRRKRVAWGLSIVLLALSVVSHLLKGFDYEEALIAGSLLMWLATQHAAFHARSDAPSIAQGVRALVAAVLGTLAYGTAGFYLLDRHFSVNFDLWTAMRQTMVMFTQFYDPGLEPMTRFGRFFADSIYVIAVAAFGYALLMILRSVLVRAPASEAERSRAEEIVERWGRSSLAATVLLPDKSYYFSPGGSVIGYAAVAGHGLALGDPIGPPEDFEATVAGFQEMCTTNDWVPVFYQTLPDHVMGYEAAGFKAVRVGHEAVVDVRAFSLAGGSKKSLRNRIHRLEDEGYTAVVHQPPIAHDLMRELEAVSDGWLTMMNGSEKRYSLGWFDPAYISACPIMAVHAPDGRVVAFANMLSEYQRPERTIDLMRHLPEALAGTMDYMFVRLFEWTRDVDGVATFNLGLSAFADVGTEAGDPLAEKVFRLIYDYVDRFYSFKGLHEYKDKFDPAWEPRFMLYPPLADLPRVFYALVRADAGEGVVLSYLHRLLGRRTAGRERPGTEPNRAPAA